MNLWAQYTWMSPRDRSPSEDPVTQTAIGKRPKEPFEPLQSDFAAVGTNYWFVCPEGNCPPDWAWFLPRFFFSVLSPIEFWQLAVVAFGLLSWGHFVGHIVSSDITLISTWLHRYYLNWTELDNAITEFNNQMPLTEKWALIFSFYISNTQFSHFDIVQLLWHNLHC